MAEPVANTMATSHTPSPVRVMAHSTPLPVVTASIDLAVGARHVHRFVPQPDGRLYGKVRWRNRCDCGTRQHPEPPTMDGAPRKLPRGPACRRCGFPTVAGTVDDIEPLHPCCAEPAVMSIGLAAARRRHPRKARR